MIAMPQATAVLYIRKFTKYIVNLLNIYQSFEKINKNKLLTLSEIFFKLKVSIFIQNTKKF